MNLPSAQPPQSLNTNVHATDPVVLPGGGAQGSAHLESARILIVATGETDCGLNFAGALKNAGLPSVGIIKSPAAAAELLEKEPHDLVIFDIDSTDLAAIEGLRSLRSNPSTSYMPFVVMTSADDRDSRLEALNAGATDVISKPVEMGELINRVRNSLNFKRYADRIEECTDLVKSELDRDALVHLHSRRAFISHIGDEFALGRTNNLSLILLEITGVSKADHAQIRQSHEARMSEAMASIESIGSKDTFATRTGSEQFAVLCHHTELDETIRLAEQIQNVVGAVADTEKVRTSELRVCVGVARHSAKVTSGEMLFDMADSALYYAKLNGDNALRIYSELESELKQHQSTPANVEDSLLLEQIDPRVGRILVVDDEPLVSGMLFAQLAESGYQNIEVENDALKAIARVHEYQPDLIILDIRMPGKNGLELLAELREDESTKSIPVLIMTSSNDDRIRMAALKLQANDFLMKPANAAELDVRVNNSLLVKFQTDQLRRVSARLRFEVEVRTKELYATRREAILCLARTAESRDDQTGLHVIRVGRYAGCIARAMGLDDDFVSWLELAAQLHDVGKIAIPDAILYKPDKLTDEEFDIMKTHCQEANRILGGADEAGFRACTSPLLQMAGRIALTHHERWDGTGYPNQLSGDQIPLEGRITSVADVFDAISSRRHYKDAFSLDESFRLLKQGAGSHFDPDVVSAFFLAKDEILQIMVENQDRILPSDEG